MQSGSDGRAPPASDVALISHILRGIECDDEDALLSIQMLIVCHFLFTLENDGLLIPISKPLYRRTLHAHGIDAGLDVSVYSLLLGIVSRRVTVAQARAMVPADGGLL